jgi:superfamily II DNA or RNA helicase
MDRVNVEKINEVFVRVEAEPSLKMEMSEYFTFEVPGAKFMPAVRNKVWDGKVRLLNVMTGYIYAGLVPYIKKFCEQRDYEITLSKELSYVEPVPDDYGVELAKQVDAAFEVRDYQNDAIVHAIRNNRALFLSPTASGKSFIIYLIMAHHLMLERKILIIVPTTSLVDQMASDFVEYNKGKKLDIHKIRGGVDKTVDAEITITTWQSVYKMPKAFFEKFDVVFGDEAHNFKAKSLTSILEKMPDAKYRYGLTGTLDGTQTHKLVLEGLFGSVFTVTKTKKLIDDNVLASFNIKALVLKYPDEIKKANKGKSYQEEIDWIVRNNSRNVFIRNLAWNLPGNTLILFQYVDKHGKALYDILSKSEEHNVYFVHGGVDTDERENIRHEVRGSKGNIICASYGTFSTGINIPELDNLIFASPSKGRIRNLQSIGRVLRKGKGKSEAVLYDIVDDLQWKNSQNFATKHFMERVKIYSEEGFQFKIYNVDIKG